MTKAELVFIPTPGMGHLVSTVEIAKLLMDTDHRLSITILIMANSFNSTLNSYIESLTSSSLSQRIRFIHLPSFTQSKSNPSPVAFSTSFVESQKPHVKQAVSDLFDHSLSGPDSSRLAGFVVDMFCMPMIDIADEFGVPSYVFFTSNASALGLALHLQTLKDVHDIDTTEFKDSDAELDLACFVKPIPIAKVMPTMTMEKEGATLLLNIARRVRQTKGIMVNTFMELESHAVNSFLLQDRTTNMVPPVFPVGPILNLKVDQGHETNEILKWLDDQPPKSVVFLCFGSMGSFGEDQVKQIASALERSGHRFLWSLRRPPQGKLGEAVGEYTNFEQVLPEGFLNRTAGRGKVIGWAPQVAVLGHEAVGGFVSHCGWNSILESLWFGVPIGAWPLYAEQQMNAYEMVKELELAVEIKIDYRSGQERMVRAEEIEKGIRELMEGESEVRKKVEGVKEKSRKALKEGGSSCTSLRMFIDAVFANMP